MVTAELEARTKLMNRRRNLLKLYEENTAEAKQLRETAEADWVDRAQEKEDEAVLTELSERERQELNSIDAALDRLAKGQFGKCDGCGKRIERARLRALPEANRCIKCSQSAEQAG